jgi:concanavalin A-like lectin/glucanase superfamily protein
MNPNTRRDILIGGAVVIVGIGLLIFAFFGDDEAFRAPRWVVAVAAIGFLAGAAVPLHAAFRDPYLHPESPLANFAIAALLLLLAGLAAWFMVGVGPEGVTLDIPFTLSGDTDRTVKSIVFHAVVGITLLACLAGATFAFARALPSLGRTAVVAVVAPLLGLVAWVAIQYFHQTPAPIPPAMSVSFDRKFPGDEYLSRVNGSEVLARPGRVGVGVFTGGNGDSLEIETPRGFDTSHGVTLEFWMKRESWINPYGKGARTQTIASLELERDWKGRPEVLHIAFSLQLIAPRDLDPPKERGRGPRREVRPELYIYRPEARVGDVRLASLRSVVVPPERWTHVAVVYDRFLFDRMRLYVDGKLVARAVPWGSAPGFADLRTLRIGTWVERNGAYRGMVDELKVYARALSGKEIAASASAGAGP